MAKDALFIIAAAAYLGLVFQIGTSGFWNRGMGDWLDPYFVNYLLEHWFVSVTTVANPVSPPMFHPAPGALGYSVSLILYVPIYIAFRFALHPFQAFNLTLFTVVFAGTVSLFIFLRRIVRVSVLEAFALTALFVTSPNVLNGWIGVWGQRASVFLIPPLLLMIAAAVRMREGLRRTALGGASGLCAALLFTHDFYTVVLASVVGVLILPVIAEPGLLRVRQRLQAARVPRPLSIVAAVLLAWALWIWISGGVSVELLGQRVSSRDWRRPASVGLAIAALLAYRDRAATIRGLFHRVPQWPLAFAGGAAIGMAAFLWIHAAAFREHPGFDHRQVFDQLVPFGTSPYLDLRPFLLAAALAGLTWIPWFGIDATTRRRATWLAIASAIVLILPMRVADASLWTVLFHLPGVSAVRDPTRLVYFYQLALSLGIGVLLVRLAPNSWLRRATIALIAALVVGRPNTTRLLYDRPNESYAQWVEMPVDINPSCRSFFVRPASAVYTSRPGTSWATYHLDAMHLAIRSSVPTLLGYSAWTPEGWGIGNPAAPDYLDGVDRWIAHNGLTAVCELDIERRIMTPYAARVAAATPDVSTVSERFEGRATTR